VLVAALRATGERLPRDPALWRHFAIAALFANALPFTMLAWGEERITSAVTSVLNASTPLFTALAAAALLRERLRAVQVTGLLAGFAGVAVAAGFGGRDLAHSSLWGAAAAVAAGACYGLAFAYMRQHLIGVPPLHAATGQLIMASAWMLPFAAGTSAVDGVHLTPTRTTAILLLGVIGTGLAYILNYRLLADLGATKTSLVTYVIPVVAVAVGVAVLGEPFQRRVLVGGALIIAGIALVHERFVPRRMPPPVTTAALLVVVALVVAGCGGSSAPSAATTTTSRATSTTAPAACTADVEEPLDPRSLQHVLPGATEPSYPSAAPTSGPHQPGPDLGGQVLTEPLSPPRQVGVLEAGDVLVQSRDVDALRQLSGDHVVIAPNPGLDHAVVATAWRHRMTCTTVDVDALRAFVADHAGKGPDAGH
jgi:drug/metabolite transporter (DMT)-like permease